MSRLGRCAAATALVVSVAGGPAIAQSTEPADEVLAVSSPVASPACTAAGLGTFLIPTVGDPLSGAVDVAAVLGQATGPVLVVCGSVSSAGSTRCELTDETVEVLWPPELAEAGIAPPAPGGSVVDATQPVTDVVGTDPTPLGEALQCSAPVPSAGAPLPSPQAPTIEPQPRSTTPAISPAAPSPSPGPAGASAPSGPAATNTPSLASAAAPQPAGIGVAARHDGNGPVLALLAVVLAAVLWRYSQRPGRLSQP